MTNNQIKERPLNLILRWLGSNGKDMMAKVISTQATSHPLPDDLVFHGDLTYKGPDGASLAADVYRPKDASADPLPIAVFVHGGGLFVGSRKANRDYVELLAQRGYMVFVPEYRLISEADGIGEISDVCAAFSYLKDHASELGGDLDRILLIGESAGGFLSLYAAALMNSRLLRESFGVEAPQLPVRGLACFGGMLYTANIDILGLVYRRSMYGERLRDEGFMQLMNPEDPRIESNLPPTLQVTSGKDFLKSYTLRFNRALALAGHDHRLMFFEKGKELTHAFPSLQPGLTQSEMVLDALDAWFKHL